MTGSTAYGGLLDALEALRDRVAAVRLPLEVEGVRDARRLRKALVEQLDDYLLPRLRRLDAPLLAVIGGSTGAGKSTLFNTLVGEQVSASGVLRPTTRAPVLAHHPGDQGWFADRRVLPGLARTTGAPGDANTLGLVAAPTVPQGLALLDAPDIDSVVTANRDLAAQLLAAADLWIFTTTAARYADAVPWDLLRDASGRSVALAVVLDRVPPEALDEVRDHLAGMLREQGLGEAPLFAVPETTVADGMLSDAAVRPLHEWLLGLAADAQARAAVVRQTLSGALDALRTRVPALADALDVQDRAVADLRGAALAAYDDAVDRVDAAMRDGSLLRGEVLARWQDFIGTGDLLRTLETRIGRLRDRIAAAVTGREPPGDELRVALETGVEALVRSNADAAAERTVSAWRSTPGGARLLAGDPAGDSGGLERSSPELAERAARMVRDWQGGVLDLVRAEAHERRSTARVLAYGINGAALLVMVAVFAHTGGLTGGEVAVAGGASALNQKLLEALLGDQAVRVLATRARTNLRDRVEELLDSERDRFVRLLDGARAGDTGADDTVGGVAEVDGDDLRRMLTIVERAR